MGGLIPTMFRREPGGMVDVVKEKLDDVDMNRTRPMEEVMTVEEPEETVHEQLDELEKAVAAVHDRLRGMEKSLQLREAVLNTKMDAIMDLLRSMCGQEMKDKERNDKRTKKKSDPEGNIGKRIDRLEERIYQNGAVNEEDFAQISHQLEDMMTSHESILQTIQEVFDLLHQPDTATERYVPQTMGYSIASPPSAGFRFSPLTTGFRFGTCESGTIKYPSCLHLASELDSERKTEPPKQKVIAKGCEQAEGRIEDIQG
jgi:hypothetical protein